MFDPTIFENLKVVLEGAVYDQDSNGTVQITNRQDRIDLSAMSRSYCIEFELQSDRRGNGHAMKTSVCTKAVLCLIAEVSDLAAEIQEDTAGSPGCRLEIRFHSDCRKDPAPFCESVRGILGGVWGNRPNIKQMLQVDVEAGDSLENPAGLLVTLLDFGRKIGEEQIEDIPMLLERTLASLRKLDQR